MPYAAAKITQVTSCSKPPGLLLGLSMWSKKEATKRWIGINLLTPDKVSVFRDAELFSKRTFVPGCQ